MGSGKGRTKRARATSAAAAAPHELGAAFVVGNEVVFVERTAHGGALRKQLINLRHSKSRSGSWPEEEMLGSLHAPEIDQRCKATCVVENVLVVSTGSASEYLYCVEFGRGETCTLANDELRFPEPPNAPLSLEDAGFGPVTF